MGGEMTGSSTRIVVRDAHGAPINIDAWDDQGGLNPLPDGATSADETVVTGWDGGLYAADDPARLAPA
jgi:hypothetical protein